MTTQRPDTPFDRPLRDTARYWATVVLVLLVFGLVLFALAVWVP